MKKAFPYLLSIICFLAIWEAVSIFLNSSLILPSPLKVLSCILELCSTKTFWLNLTATFLRVLFGFVIALIFGTALGFVCGISSFWNTFFSFPLSLLKTTPVAALILILIFAFNSSSIPIISAVLMCLPVMSECVKRGVIFDRTSEGQKKLYKMAEVFQFNQSKKILHIFWPSFKSFWTGGIISIFGMCWKVVAAGEILTVPRYAAGTFLYKNQVSLETAEVFAMTIALIALSSIFEGLLKWTLKSKN